MKLDNNEKILSVDAAKQYANKCKKDQTQEKYIKHPKNWINDKRWTDEAVQPINWRLLKYEECVELVNDNPILSKEWETADPHKFKRYSASN